MEKRIGICFLIVVLYSTAFAHAGLYDRYLEMMININAITLVIAVTQIACYLILRYCKVQWLLHYKKIVIKWAKYIYKRAWMRWTFAWGLSSFVFSPYVYCFCAHFFIFALIPLLLFWLFYCSWVWRKEKRKKCLTGFRALSRYISVTVQQGIGYVLYALVCKTSVFHAFVYYTDKEYEIVGLRLYPGIEGIEIEGIVTISVLFVIPFIILFLAKFVVLLRGKTKTADLSNPIG